MSLSKIDYPLQDRYIRVSSEDKYQGTNSRFRVALQSTGQQIDKISSFSLKFASCPNVFNNITSLNNNFQVGFGGPATETDLNLNVTPGYYTLDALIAELNTIIANQIIANGDAYTFVLSKVGTAPYQKVQFDVNGLSAGSCQLFSSDNSIYPNLGVETTPNAIPPNVPVTIVNGVPFIAQNIPNIIGETEVYIHSRVLNQGGLTEANGNFSVVGVIPLGDTPYGAVAQIFEPDHKSATIKFEPFESTKSFRNIDVVLRNRTGQVLELPSNFTFTMMLKAKYDLISR
ncbi:MAG: hypothetical protein JSV32_08080 [Dehalococcoidia bacterium]|nr:MAG: hypothetical protein JSV32_08080 [Dehalococcoidia bacterium]